MLLLNYENAFVKKERVVLSNDSSVSDNGDLILGEREHAGALYLACKHLPRELKTSRERAGMLAEAAKTLEKIGDKRGLEDCYKLMKNVGASSATS